jgi:class 3 adenylate cyclase/CheY-like chemotaxis protein
MLHGMRAQKLTFFFSDVEGSTRLVRELGDHYGDLLIELRAVLRGAIEESGGRVVDMRADEVFAVFQTPREAVSAAIAAQQALCANSWLSESTPRVRIGLHTGVAREDGRNDYVGIEVHRAARIANAAHGGQVLLSEATAAAVEHDVRDLGEYELDGLGEPERIFQLLHETLDEEFPMLRSGPPRRGLTVALADDSVIVREGIARLLTEAGIEVVSQAGTPADLLRNIEENTPDVAVVDIRMPPSGSDEGLRAAKTIRSRYPGVGVVLLSQALEPAYAAELVADSPTSVGYLLKDRVGDLDEFAAALHRVAEGGLALDPALVS